MIKIFELSLHGYITNEFNNIEYLYVTIDGMSFLLDTHPVDGICIAYPAEGRCTVHALIQPVDIGCFRGKMHRDGTFVGFDSRTIVENLCTLGIKKCSGTHIYYIDGMVDVIKRDLLLFY